MRTLVVLTLLACVSGFTPFLAQALQGGVVAGAYEDPCGDCPDDDGSDELPCSPNCSDCFCGPGSRVSPERKLLIAWQLPHVFTAMPESAPPSIRSSPQESPALDGLLRPPRA